MGVTMLKDFAHEKNYIRATQMEFQWWRDRGLPITGNSMEVMQHIEKLEAALAEKDAQLARRPTREWEHSLQMSLRGKNDAIAELNKKYSALMAQAVRFAVRARDWGTSSVITEAQAFLNSDEVQAYQAQQKGE